MSLLCSLDVPGCVQIFKCTRVRLELGPESRTGFVKTRLHVTAIYPFQTPYAGEWTGPTLDVIVNAKKCVFPSATFPFLYPFISLLGDDRPLPQDTDPRRYLPF